MACSGIADGLLGWSDGTVRLWGPTFGFDDDSACNAGNDAGYLYGDDYAFDDNAWDSGRSCGCLSHYPLVVTTAPEEGVLRGVNRQGESSFFIEGEISMFFCGRAGHSRSMQTPRVKSTQVDGVWTVKRRPRAKALVICRDVRRAKSPTLNPKSNYKGFSQSGNACSLVRC